MELILKYFPDLSRTQQEQFASLPALYEEWNAKINVISRKDIQHLYLKHVLHSLSIARVFSFPPGTKILDIGTGGGFPGIPLAILFPEASFYLVDSTGKKIKVTTAIARALDLRNVATRHARVETLNGTFDVALAKAVARLPRLWEWCAPLLTNKKTHPHGLIALKGGDLTEELRDIPEKTKVYKISDFFSEAWFEDKKIVHVGF